MCWVRFGLAAWLAFGAACQRKEGNAPPPPASSSPAARVATSALAHVGERWQGTPLARDLDRICNVIERSGAAQLPEGERVLATTQWLPANIESEAGREFLASIANLDGDAKAAALDEGARKAGLASCPTAELWRGR